MMANTCLNVKHKIKMNKSSKNSISLLCYIWLSTLMIKGNDFPWTSKTADTQYKVHKKNLVFCLLSKLCRYLKGINKDKVWKFWTHLCLSPTWGVFWVPYCNHQCSHYYFFFRTFNTIPSILADSFNLSSKFFLVTHHNNVVKIWETLKTWSIFNEKSV